MEPNKIITDYHSCRDLIKYQLIEEDVGVDGMTIWYKETFVTSDLHGNIWLEEIEHNKDCINGNNFTTRTPLVKLEKEN